MTTKCDKCKGTGIAKPSKVLSWGICIPEMKCRYCYGKGYLSNEGNK